MGVRNRFWLRGPDALAGASGARLPTTAPNGICVADPVASSGVTRPDRSPRSVSYRRNDPGDRWRKPGRGTAERPRGIAAAVSRNQTGAPPPCFDHALRVVSGAFRVADYHLLENRCADGRLPATVGTPSRFVEQLSASSAFSAGGQP